MKITESTFSKGSIFLTQFPFTNLEQSKIRPVVVISYNGTYGDVTVMAISSVTSRRDLSQIIILSPADAEFSETGLKRESCILVHRIATIKKDRLFYHLGNLAQRYLDDIDKLVLHNFEIGSEEKQKQQIIPYGKQSVDAGDIFSVIKVLRSDWLTTGPKVPEFEEIFAHFVNAKYAVAVSSGTAALHTAMYALRIGPGDEVIIPPITFAATANCVVFQGGTPVFADVEPDTLLLDPVQVEAKITPHTKAIIAVDYAGQACDYDALRSIAERHGLFLVADACHALGGSYKGRKVGSLADLNIFSFHPVKHITTGEGGMITTDDSKLAERMRIFRNHGITRDPKMFTVNHSPFTNAQRTTDNGQRTTPSWYYEMLDLGYNYRLTDVQCALGLSQLKKLDGWIARRREIAHLYDQAFQDNPRINPLSVNDEVLHPYHLYVVRLDLDGTGLDRSIVFRKLRKAGIGVNVHYIPVYLHPFYQKRFHTKVGLCPNAEAAYEQIISLPMYPSLLEKEQSFIIESIGKMVS